MMRRLLHAGVELGALFLTLGIPALCYGAPGLPGDAPAPDALSAASVELPESPSGNFVVLLNRDRHEGTAAAWETFFTGGETEVIMDDVACMTAKGDAGGLRLARRFQARLAENQLSLRQVEGTLLASRAEEGVFDLVILSQEMAEALALDGDRPGTALLRVRGETS